MTVETQTNDPNDEFLIEQTQIQDVNTDAPLVHQPAAEAEPAQEQEQQQEQPSDPRAAALERIAERRRNEANDEIRQVAEITTDPTAPKPVAAEPVADKAEDDLDRMVTMKIRGETVQKPLREVIATAQRVDATESYLDEARNLVHQARQTATEVRNSPEVRHEAQAKVDRLAEVIEQIQLGGDPAEVRQALDDILSERAQGAARQIIDQDRNDRLAARIDADVEVAYADLDKEFGATVQDDIARDAIHSLSGRLASAKIAEFLAGADPETQNAFAQSRITPETLKFYTPQEAHTLYRDMVLKGYQLPPPAAVHKAAGTAFAQRFGGSTQPSTTAPQGSPPNRTQRKETIQQPQRASVPRDTTTGRFVPQQTEQERARQNRAELRNDRRGVRVS